MSARGLFCLSGVGKYEADTRMKYGINDLRSVPVEITTMRAALTSLGLVEYLSFDDEERSHDELKLSLTQGDSRGAESLVIYCTGHGRLRSGRYQLLLPKGNPFHPAELIEPLEEDEWNSLREVVLIVDACSAEPGLDEALAEARKVNTQTSKLGFWGIAASRRLETAEQGSFATAFAAALSLTAQPSWTISHLDPAAIANRVNRALGPGQTVWLAEGHPAEPCRVFPNPRHQNASPPSGLPLPSDWATAARGVAASSMPGFFFTGRKAALYKLREHLESDDAVVAVVTGKPGAGRSALLGHLFLTIHGRGRQAMPDEVQLSWPPLPITIAAGKGDPAQATRMLIQQLADPGEIADLAGVLASARKPLGIVLDDLDESTGPELWSEFFATLRSVPDVRLVVGLPTSSAIRVPGSRRHNLDDLVDKAAQDVRDYLDLQIRLAVPGAPREEIGRAVNVLAGRVGLEFEVAVALTGIFPTHRDRQTVGDYLVAATKAVDVAAHRVCRTRLDATLGAKAPEVVSALSALCSYDSAIALPAADWAAVASTPGGPSVSIRDVAAAAQLMGSLVEECPAEDGTPRWRARFGHPDASGYPKPDLFLQRLPQVARPDAVDWRSVDPSVLVLVARAAVLGLIPGRLLDDPAFLLTAPPAVVSKAIQLLRADTGERRRRSRMWRLTSQGSSASDRALLLRIAAQRFDVRPIVAAFETSRRPAGQDEWQLAESIEWVQPDRSRDTRVIHLAATAPGPGAAVVTAHDNGSLAFWDPSDGTSLREVVSVPGGPRSVAVAVVRGEAIALVSTWQGRIWLMPCRANDAPTPVPELIPPYSGYQAEMRIVPLLLALHPSGQVVVVAGQNVWVSRLGARTPMKKRMTLDSEVISIQTAGPVGAAVAWLVPESGRVRRLQLDDGPSPTVTPFPIPQRPLTLGAAETGDRALIADIAGGLHVRGTSSASTLTREVQSSEVRAVALNDSIAAVVGGSADQPGWLEIHDLIGWAAPARIPLDEGGMGVVMHGADRMLIARASGLLSMRWTRNCPGRTAEHRADSDD